MTYHGGIRYWIQQKEELMEVNNKMNTLTLHHAKATKKNIIESVIEIWYPDSNITKKWF